MLDSADRLLAREGAAALGTTSVAREAGISVGSLYQWFPNKEAILLAMARRETETVRASVAKALTDDLEHTDTSPIRLAIRALIKGYGRRNKARRILMETLIADMPDCA